MNDDSPNHLELRAIESRLMSMVFPLPVEAQHKLLYDCAFAAGRENAKRNTRWWQAAAAGLVLLVGGLSISAFRSAASLPDRSERPEIANVREASSITTDFQFPVRAQETAHISLDAWQVEAAGDGSLSAELAQFEQIDPKLRALGMAALTRSFFQPSPIPEG